MPLSPGKSREAFESNIGELIRSYRETGKVGNSTPKTTDKARKQALAIAFAEKDK